jgi:hypothetical protein
VSDQWEPTPIGTPPGGYGAPPPGYQPPPYGYGYPPPTGWYGGGYQPYGYYGYYGEGMPGKIRPTGISILLFVCTLGIYSFVYNYSVHNEMRRHSGRGIGGGVALLLTFFAHVAMPFITSSEVGSLYSRRGQPAPVSGWTGLWGAAPFLFGVLGQILALFVFLPLVLFGSFTAGGVGIVTVIVAILVAAVVGGIVWFVKTNEALNDYWASVGVPVT